MEAANGLIGSLAQRANSDDLDLHFHGMLLAEAVESSFEEPTKPEGVEEDSAENKAYLRAMAELERKRPKRKRGARAHLAYASGCVFGLL